MILINLIDIVRASASRPARAWLQLALYAVVFVVVMFNNFVHARDGWTSVVPQGLVLSATAVILMIIASFVGYKTLRSEVMGG